MFSEMQKHHLDYKIGFSLFVSLVAPLSSLYLHWGFCNTRLACCPHFCTILSISHLHPHACVHNHLEWPYFPCSMSPREGGEAPPSSRTLPAAPCPSPRPCCWGPLFRASTLSSVPLTLNLPTGWRMILILGLALPVARDQLLQFIHTIA